MAIEGEGELKAGLTDLRAQVNDWSLATDDNLLVLLRKFSEHLINRVNAMDDELQGLVENTRNTEISVANTFNRFLMLRNSQFIENCVFNDSPEQEEMQSTTKPQPMTENEKHVAKFNKFKAALNKGMEAMALAPRIRQPNSEDDPEQPPSLPNPRDIWNQRPLPFIIGTRRFQDDDNLGLIDYHDDPVYNEHLRKQDEPPEAIEEEKADGAIDGDVVPAANSEAPSDEDKEDWSWLAPKTSSVLATMDMRDPDDLLGLSAFQDLFRGLDEERVAHLHRHLDENESGIIMVSDLVRFLKEHHRPSDDIEREESDEVAAQGEGPALIDILANKFQRDQEDAKIWDEAEDDMNNGPPPVTNTMKNKNKRKDTSRSAQHKALFGSDSEDEDGGMFSTKKEDDVERLLNQATMFAIGPDEKDDMFGDTKPKESVHEDLFGNDEEEDDFLFPGASKRRSKRKSERKSKKKDKDLFGDSEDEDIIFGAAPKKEKLVIDPSRLLPGAKRPSKKKSEANPETAIVVKKGLKNEDLFGPSDDEDEDFFASSRPTKAKKNSVKKAPKANIFGSDSEEDDLFSTKTKKKESITKVPVGVGINIFDDGSDDGDLFGGASAKKKTTTAPAKKKPVKNDIFGDTDSDSEDLFGGSSKKKKPAATPEKKSESPEKKTPAEVKKPEKTRGSLGKGLNIDPSRLLPGSARTVKQIKRKTTGEEKTVVETKPTQQKLFESDDDDDLFAAKEKASKKKKRRIFDSDSDDDIFAIKKTTVAPKKKGLLFGSSSSDDDFIITKKTKPKPKPGAEGKKKKKKLFDSSTEEEEEVKKPAPVETKTKPVEKIPASATTPSATTTSPKKTTPKAAGKIVFDPSKLRPGAAQTVAQIKRRENKPAEEKETITTVEKVTVDPLADDEDGDLFATKGKADSMFSKKTKENVVKTAVESEDDDDLFSTKPKTSIKTSKLLESEDDDDDLFSRKPKVSGKPAAKKKANRSDLFGSSDDDDDIFSIRPKKKKPEAKPKKEPVKEVRPAETKVDRWGASSEDDDDIFAVKKTAPKKSSPKKKVSKVDLFGDSDDDEDLFATRKKPKPQAKVVKEATPPRKSPTPPKEPTPPPPQSVKKLPEETPVPKETPTVATEEKQTPIIDEPPVESKEESPTQAYKKPTPEPVEKEPTPPKESVPKDGSEGPDAEPASVLAFNRSVKVLKDDKPKKSRGKRKKQSSKIAALGANIKIGAFAPGAKPPKKSSKISAAANNLNINPALTMRPGAAPPVEEKKSDGTLEHVESSRPMQKGRRARSRRGKKRTKQPKAVNESKAAPPEDSKEDDIKINIVPQTKEVAPATIKEEPASIDPLGGSMTITEYDPLSSMTTARDPMASTVEPQVIAAEPAGETKKTRSLFDDDSKTRPKIESIADPFAMDNDDDLFGTKRSKPDKKPATRVSVDLFGDSSPPPPKKTTKPKEEPKKPRKEIDLFGDSDEDIFATGKKSVKRGPSLFGEEEDELFGGKKKSKKKKNRNLFDDDDDEDLFS